MAPLKRLYAPADSETWISPPPSRELSTQEVFVHCFRLRFGPSMLLAENDLFFFFSSLAFGRSLALEISESYA